MTRVRLSAEARKDTITQAVINLAQGKNYMRVTRDEVAESLGVSGPAVQHHFGTMKQLQRSAMRHALQRAAVGDKKALRVVAQGLADGSGAAAKASDAVRAAAKALL